MVPASPGTAFTIPATAMPLKDMCSRNGTPPVQTVFLRAGQMVALRAEGAVQAGGAFPKVGPAGQGSYPMNKPCMPIQGLPLMRLLGQFNGTVFDAGVTGVTFTAPADGWLHFGFNDDLFHDNTGTLDLTITGDFQPGAAAAASPTDIESAASPSLVCPILALPKYDNDDSTKGIFFINLDTGNAFFIDRVKRDPLSVRTRTMNQNIFAALDRTPGTPAGPGQVLAGEIRDGSGNVTALLLVDSTTGAMAYYADLKSQSYRGTVRKIAGNLAAALAAPDGNFALLMQRASSGETQGAYLYHAATGRALYFPKMGNLPSTPAASSVTSLPRMEGTVSALDLQAGNEATEAFLLADNAAGVLYHVGGVERRPDQLTVTRYPINLFDHFPHQAAVKTPRRFVPVPLFNGSGATQDVLILDTGTGAMAVLKGALQPRKAKVQPVRKNLYDHLPAGVGRPRVWTAVPKVAGNGATEGAWIFDSATGEVLYLDSIDDPSGLAVRRVDQRTR